MLVSITHQEVKRGLLLKVTYHEIACDVQFNEEELHIIKTANLGNVVVLKRDYPHDKRPNYKHPDHYWLRIKNFLKPEPDRWVVNSPGSARLYEEQLREALKGMKAYIEDSQPISGTEQFEL